MGCSMHYFVTGATGFIGKRLVKKLLARKGSVVYFLLRKESEAKLADAPIPIYVPKDFLSDLVEDGRR